MIDHCLMSNYEGGGCLNDIVVDPVVQTYVRIEPGYSTLSIIWLCKC